MPVKFDLTTLHLPTSGEYVGTWGSGLVTHPELPMVLLSLPRGSGLLPWVTVDLQTGAISKGSGLRGELRDGLASGNEALCLTTHAVCRLRLLPEPTVVATYRPKGLGTYLWRMLDFGPDLIGVTGWASKSVLVLRRADGSVVKRIPAIAPQSSTRIDDRLLRVFALHGGEVVDIDLQTLKASGRHRVPGGTRAVAGDGEVFALTGTRCAVPNVDIDRIWRIAPKELVAFDTDLRVVRKVPAPSHAREVLGISNGTLVIATDSGVVLVRASDLVELGAFNVERFDIWQHAFVPASNSVVISPRRFMSATLRVVQWEM